MAIVYDKNGKAVTATEKDAEDMVKYCGYVWKRGDPITYQKEPVTTPIKPKEANHGKRRGNS